MLLIAHAGHWFVGAAYLAPVVCFGTWVTIVTIRDRRAEREGEGKGAGKNRRSD